MTTENDKMRLLINTARLAGFLYLLIEDEVRNQRGVTQ
jgi:hypothetical protein